MLQSKVCRGGDREKSGQSEDKVLYCPPFAKSLLSTTPVVRNAGSNAFLLDEEI